MPRRDVPYPTGGGVICRIKEELRALWARAGSCINKINNTTPDGDGNFQINAGTGIVVSQDGNGVEISAASMSYTGLDPIVVDNDTLEISAPTVVVQDDLDDYYDKDTTDGLLAGKADVATSLAGYGITDAVTLDTSQTITALKDISPPHENIIKLQCNVVDLDTVDANANARITIYDKNGRENSNRIGLIRWNKNSNEARLFLAAGNKVNGSNTFADLTVRIPNDGSAAYVTAPYRAYASDNTADIVTIGSLARNPSVIHAIGNEEIGGSKRFILPIRKVNANMTQGKPTSSFISDLFSFQTSGGQIISEIFMLYGTDGSVKLIARNVNPDGTMGSSVTIATLRAAY